MSCYAMSAKRVHSMQACCVIVIVDVNSDSLHYMA